MPPPKAVEWWLRNKWLVAVVSLFVLAGSTVVSRMSDEQVSSEPPSPAGPGFEAPPKTKLPKLTRAAVESLVAPPPGDKSRAVPEPDEEAVGDAKAEARGRRADVSAPDIAAALAAAGSASAGGPKAPGGKLEKMGGFGKGDSAGGGGGGGPSVRGGGAAHGEGGEARAPSQAAGQGGAASFIKRQFANASRRLARVFGGANGPRQSGMPSGNSSASSGTADTGPGPRTQIGADGGARATGNGASTPQTSPSNPPSSGPTSSSGGGGGGSAPAAAPKPITPAAPSPTPTPHATSKKDEDKAPESAAAGRAEAETAMDLCSKNKSTTKCAVLTCLDDLDVWTINAGVTKDVHLDPYSPSGGYIVPHFRRILEQTLAAQTAINELYYDDSLVGYFQACEDCDDAMKACPQTAKAKLQPAFDLVGKIVGNRERGREAEAEAYMWAVLATVLPPQQRPRAVDGMLSAMVSAARPRKGLVSAIGECAKDPIPSRQTSVDCKLAGDKGKADDVELALAIKSMGQAADCSGQGPPEAVETWNGWAQRVRSKVESLSKNFDKTWCPDRTRCEPSARYATELKKMDVGTRNVSVFREDLPAVVGYFEQAHKDNGSALASLAKAPQDEGALREFVFHSDGASHYVHLARVSFESEKAAACKVPSRAETRRPR